MCPGCSRPVLGIFTVKHVNTQLPASHCIPASHAREMAARPACPSRGAGSFDLAQRAWPGLRCVDGSVTEPFLALIGSRPTACVCGCAQRHPTSPPPHSPAGPCPPSCPPASSPPLWGRPCRGLPPSHAPRKALRSPSPRLPRPQPPLRVRLAHAGAIRAFCPLTALSVSSANTMSS